MRGDERMSGGAEGLDARIDAALRSYLEAPEFSDPQVVLARVRMLAEQERRSRWRVWMWAVPASVAALIAVVALVWVAQRPTSPQIAFVPKAPGVARVASPDSQPGERKNAGPSTPVARATSAQDDRALGASVKVRRGESRRKEVRDQNDVVVAERRLPKLEVFPAPQPLSEQERALVAFATHAPPEATEQLIEAQKHLGDPIQIAAIEIRPLNEDEQKSEPKGKDMR